MSEEERQESMERRQRNRKGSEGILLSAGVTFERKNIGADDTAAHLIVKSGKLLIDFWPGTGLWRTRHVCTCDCWSGEPDGSRHDRGCCCKWSEGRGRGVRNLLRRIA